MPKSYADLLKEARSQIKEVSPPEADLIRERGATTFVDVREASEWEQGHLPGAVHISKSYIEQQIEGALPDRDAPVGVADEPGLLQRARHHADRRALHTEHHRQELMTETEILLMHSVVSHEQPAGTPLRHLM